MQTGPLNLITDVEGLRVGNAQDYHIKTGCTVLTSDQPFLAGVHVMGGAPGTRETDLLAPDRLVQQVDALVLSGGSAFGLDAASGVADAMRAAGRGFQVAGQSVPIIPGAILFDLANGGDKNWTENPYKKLGQQAYGNIDQRFDLGSIGAGTGATTATFKGGLGSSSTVLENGITVGALVAVNALGSATVGDSKHFWAAPFEIADEFGGLGTAVDFTPTSMPKTKLTARANTTIAIVATDAALTQSQATRVAIAAHDGMARALVPAHTPFDGDLVFAAATGRNTATITDIDIMHIGHAAATCLARAIARGVFHAKPSKADFYPCWANI